MNFVDKIALKICRKLNLTDEQIKEVKKGVKSELIRLDAEKKKNA